MALGSKGFVLRSGRQLFASALTDFSASHLTSQSIKPLVGVTFAVVDELDCGFVCHRTADKRVGTFSDRFINEIFALVAAACSPLKPNGGEGAGAVLRVAVSLNEVGREIGRTWLRRQYVLLRFEARLFCSLSLGCAAGVGFVGHLPFVEVNRNRRESVVGRVVFTHLPIPRV